MLTEGETKLTEILKADPGFEVILVIVTNLVRKLGITRWHHI